MTFKINKSKELKNPNIRFLSMVGEPNIMKSFLVAKSKKGKNEMKYIFKNKIISGQEEIIKSLGFDDVEIPEGHHLCIGCAYPANQADYDDEFMKEEAVSLVKKTLEQNGNMVDLEHDEEHQTEITIAKSIILEEDMQFYGEDNKHQVITKGSMISGVIVKEDIFKKIEDKEITGFSIGGEAEIVEEETDLNLLQKTVGAIAKAVGIKTDIKKGVVLDKYNKSVPEENVNTGWWKFRDYVFPRDDNVERTEEEKRTAIDDFVKILEANILSDPINGITLLKNKGGKSMTEKEQQDLVKNITKSVTEEVNKGFEEKFETMQTENKELKKKVEGFEEGKLKEIEKAKNAELVEVKKYAVKKSVEITKEDTLETSILKCVKNFNPNFEGNQEEANGAWQVIKSMYKEDVTEKKDINKNVKPKEDTAETKRINKMMGVNEGDED